MLTVQDHYQKAIRYAAQKHAERHQTLPDTIIPYDVHLSNVVLEILVAAMHKDFDTEFTMQVALFRFNIAGR